MNGEDETQVEAEEVVQAQEPESETREEPAAASAESSAPTSIHARLEQAEAELAALKAKFQTLEAKLRHFL